MKTGNLIQVLVADGKPPRYSLERLLLLALLAGFVAVAAPYWLFHGPRADMAAALMTPRFLFKIAEVLLLAAVAAILVLRLIRPGADARRGLVAIMLPPVLLLIAVGIELFVIPAQEWRRNLVGDNYYVCLVSVFALSLPLLGAALFALREGAPERPALAGGIAGLLAGGLAAAIYAVQCTDDSPLFVATWYTLAILAAGAAGALAGRRILRW